MLVYVCLLSSSGETAKAAAAAVLLVALSSLQLKDSGADTSGQHMLLVAGERVRVRESE